MGELQRKTISRITEREQQRLKEVKPKRPPEVGAIAGPEPRGLIRRGRAEYYASPYGSSMQKELTYRREEVDSPASGDFQLRGMIRYFSSEKEEWEWLRASVVGRQVGPDVVATSRPRYIGWSPTDNIRVEQDWGWTESYSEHPEGEFTPVTQGIQVEDEEAATREAKAWIDKQMDSIIQRLTQPGEVKTKRRRR